MTPRMLRNRALTLIAPLYVILILDGVRLIATLADLLWLRRKRPDVFVEARATVYRLVAGEDEDEERRAA